MYYITNLLYYNNIMKQITAQKILIKVKNDYNEIANDFDITRVNSWPEFAVFDKYIKNNSHILDVGCGNGRLLKSLPRKINYTGIDVSNKLIKIAKQSFTGAIFKTGDILNLKLNKNSFNIVLAIAVLNHVPSEKLRIQAVKEIYRVLKPGGYLLMTNWNLYQKKYKYLVKKNSDGFDKGDALVPWRNPEGELLQERYYHSFTLKELEYLAKQNHLKIIKQFYSLKGKPVERKNGYNTLSVWQKQ